MRIVTKENKINLLLPDAFFDDENASHNKLYEAVEDFYNKNLSEKDAEKAIDELSLESSNVYMNSDEDMKNAQNPEDFSASIFVWLPLIVSGN